jgi:microcystin degradation protein MlrC
MPGVRERFLTGVRGIVRLRTSSKRLGTGSARAWFPRNDILGGMMGRRSFLAAASLPLAAQAKPLRVAVASIMHESNSFNPAKTELVDFRFVAADSPSATLERWAADYNEVAGFIARGRQEGFILLPVLQAGATPKGPVSKEAFETLTSRLLAGLDTAKPFDAIYLALHGALYSDEFPQGDEEIIRRVRERFPKPMPLVVTHDFHANVSPATVEMTTVLLAYKQTPHLDQKDRGVQAAQITGRMLRGEVKPVQTIIKPPMIYNLVFHNTFAEPMKPLTQASIDLENANPKVLAASVLGGYQFNDCPYMGPSVIVVTDGDRDLAEREAKRLSDMMWNQRDRLKLDLPDAKAAVERAIKATKHPVALFDMGDNIGGGSAGDSTFLLDQLIQQKADGWVYVLYDPAAVDAAKRSGIDGDFDMPVGGKSDNAHGKPIRIRGKVKSLHNGRYIETEVRHGGGRYWNVGHAAVIEVQGSTPDLANLLVVTTARSSPNSIHQIVSLGIYPERQKILVAKGTVAPRAAYEPVAAEIIMVDTPGATSVNPARYTFRRLRPGVWGVN